MTSARTAANSLAATLAMCAALLYRYSPQEYSFYPRCPFYLLTHRLCPGCGATRAVAELLHGHLAAAMHFNAALVLLLPLLLVYFGRMYWTAVRESRVEWPQAPAWSWPAILTGVLFFTLARNLSSNSL